MVNKTIFCTNLVGKAAGTSSESKGKGNLEKKMKRGKKWVGISDFWVGYVYYKAWDVYY